MGKLRRSGSGGDFVSIRWERPSIDDVIRKATDEAQRRCVIEAATKEAADRGFGDDWTIEVTMNMDDGGTLNATVVKATDGEAEITAWDPDGQRDRAGDAPT